MPDLSIVIMKGIRIGVMEAANKDILCTAFINVTIGTIEKIYEPHRGMVV